MDKIIGAFVFPDVWQAWTTAEARDAFTMLSDFGVNTIFTEADRYRDDLISLAHALGLRWVGGIACFSDHLHGNQLLRDRPELWPVDELGRRRPQMEWYIGVTPTFRTYNQQRIQLAERLVAEHNLDGFMLDFIRWPLHWELEMRPGADGPRQSSFDAHTLTRFQEEMGVKLPGHLAGTASQASWILRHRAEVWRNFKCQIITDVVRQAAERLRQAGGSDLTIGLFALPLPADELEIWAGQRLADLAPEVDVIAPMVYHAILHRSVDWAAETVRSFVRRVPEKTLPVLQAASSESADTDADWGPPVSPEAWGAALDKVLNVPGTRGAVAFTGSALFEDDRGQRLRASLARHGWGGG